MKIGLTGLGTYTPEKILTNDDLSKIVDTNDEWIVSRTGIKERHIAEESETTADLAIKSAENLFQKINANPLDIDMIICSTVTAEQQFPSISSYVQKHFEIHNAPIFDIGPACGGFVYLLATAESFIKAGFAKKILCVCAEKFSRLVDWTDRNTCILFGDGAASFIVEQDSPMSTILQTSIGGDGQYADLLRTDVQDGGRQFVHMDGTTVFKQAVRIMDEQVRLVCGKAKKSLEDVDLLIPHQANARIMKSVAERLGMPEKAFMNIHKYGNTSSATIPLAMNDAMNEGVLTKGKLVVCPALGGGFTWGASLIQF